MKKLTGPIAIAFFEKLQALSPAERDQLPNTMGYFFKGLNGKDADGDDVEEWTVFLHAPQGFPKCTLIGESDSEKHCEDWLYDNFNGYGTNFGDLEP